MNKDELKKLIKDLTAEMEAQTDPVKKAAQALQLQRAVETYVAMIVPQNRMMTGGSDE